MPSDDIFARIEAAWHDFQDAVAGIPDERMLEPGAVGAWSVKDTLAHIAYWHESMVDRALRMAQGDDLPEPDLETINRVEAQERAGWSLEHARAEAQRTHALAVATARAMPDIDLELLEGDTWGHYAAHAADIRAWRAAQGI